MKTIVVLLCLTVPTFAQVSYKPSLTSDECVTAPQRALAAQLLAAFAFEPRRPRSRASVLAAVQGLTASQRNLLLAAMAVDFLQREPDFAQKLGINLDGDEIDPNALLKG